MDAASLYDKVVKLRSLLQGHWDSFIKKNFAKIYKCTIVRKLNSKMVSHWHPIKLSCDGYLPFIGPNYFKGQ